MVNVKKVYISAFYCKVDYTCLNPNHSGTGLSEIEADVIKLFLNGSSRDTHHQRAQFAAVDSFLSNTKRCSLQVRPNLTLAYFFLTSIVLSRQGLL